MQPGSKADELQLDHISCCDASAWDQVPARHLELSDRAAASASQQQALPSPQYVDAWNSTDLASSSHRPRKVAASAESCIYPPGQEPTKCLPRGSSSSGRQAQQAQGLSEQDVRGSQAGESCAAKVGPRASHQASSKWPPWALVRPAALEPVADAVAWPGSAPEALTGDWRTVSTDTEQAPLPQLIAEAPSSAPAQGPCQSGIIPHDKVPGGGKAGRHRLSHAAAVESQDWSRSSPMDEHAAAGGMCPGDEAQLATVHGGRPVRKGGLRASWEARHPRMSAWTRRKQAGALEQAAPQPGPHQQHGNFPQPHLASRVHSKPGMVSQENAGQEGHAAQMLTRTVSSFGAMASDAPMDQTRRLDAGICPSSHQRKASHAPAAAWAMTKRLWRR